MFRKFLNYFRKSETDKLILRILCYGYYDTFHREELIGLLNKPDVSEKYAYKALNILYPIEYNNVLTIPEFNMLLSVKVRYADKVFLTRVSASDVAVSILQHRAK